MNTEAKIDNRQARSESTRQALMRAAEKLIAESGIENVTIRLILTEAGQKNTSALQYHFRNLKGLINAIHAQRSAEVQEARAQMLENLKARQDEPTLRNLCELMVMPAVSLARTRIDYRRYVKASVISLRYWKPQQLSRPAVRAEAAAAARKRATYSGKNSPTLTKTPFVVAWKLPCAFAPPPCTTRQDSRTPLKARRVRCSFPA